MFTRSYTEPRHATIQKKVRLQKCLHPHLHEIPARLALRRRRVPAAQNYSNDYYHREIHRLHPPILDDIKGARSRTHLLLLLESSPT